MRNIFFLIFFCCLTVSFSQSKEFKITGKIQAEDDKTPLESATIYLERIKDSSLVTYTISDKNGNFTLEDETSDNNLNLFISYVGFQTYIKAVKIDKAEIDLQTISLKTQNKAD